MESFSKDFFSKEHVLPSLLASPEPTGHMYGVEELTVAPAHS